MKFYNRPKKSNKGMTMVEVLMGFVVLITFLGGMSSIIAFSSNLLYRSIDLKRDLQVIQGELYKKAPDVTNHDGVTLELKVTEVNGDKNTSPIIGKTVALGDALLYDVDSNTLKANGADISDEGLDITIYGIGYKDTPKN